MKTKYQIFSNVKVFATVLFFSCISFLNSCKNSENPKNVIVIDVNDNISHNISEVYESFELVQMETIEGLPIGEITSLKVFDSSLLVYDALTEGIFQYSLNGKYINNIQRIGRGPGEYTEITDYLIHNGQIILLTNRKDLLYFTENAVFIKQEELPLFCDRVLICENEMFVITEDKILSHSIFKIENSRIVKKFNQFDPSLIKHSAWPLQSVVQIDNGFFHYDLSKNSVIKYYDSKTTSEFILDFKMQEKKHTGNLNEIPIIQGISFFESILFVQFTFNSEMYHFFYSVNTGVSKIMSTTSLVNDINNIDTRILFYRGYSDNYFYASISPAFLNMLNEEVAHNGVNSNTQEFNDNDNDVLLKLKVKRF